MPDPLKKFGSHFQGKQTFLRHRVYAKVNWTDTWEEQEHVVCTDATWASAPSMSSAELYYRYGPGLFPGERIGDWLQRYELPTLAYVRVDFTVAVLGDDELLGQTPTTTIKSWYGVVGTLVDSFLGSDVSSTSGNTTTYIVQGKQTLRAVGLEWLLDRQYVLSSKWVGASNGAVQSTRRAFDFNSIANSIGQNRSKNLKENSGTYFSYVFQPDDSENFWSTKNIVEYLLAWFAGQNSAGAISQKWRLVDTYLLLPTWDSPIVSNVHGQTVWGLLNQLLPRQRGYSFAVEVFGDLISSSDGALIHIIPFTINAEDIVISAETTTGPNHTLKANPNQKRIDLTKDRTCGQIAVVKDSFSEYDQIHCYGARAVHVASLKYDDAFTKAWESADETEYEAGGSGDTGYPPDAEEIADRQRWSAEARHKPSLEHVYRRFKIKTDWDFKVAPVPDLVTNDVTVFPDYDDPIGNPGSIVRVIPYNELEFDQQLPMFAGVDYTSRTTTADEHPTSYTTLKQLGPMAFFKSGDTWIAGDSINITEEIEGEDEEKNYHFVVRVEPLATPGHFNLQVSGQPQHVIADAAFTGQAHDLELGGLDYANDKCYVTLAFLADYHCEARHPEPLSSGPDFDPMRHLRIRSINMGDNYRFDFMCKSTIYAVEAKELLYAHQDTILRDDRPKLKQIAELAFAWYGRTRQALSFSTQFLTDALSVGDMITGMVVDRNGEEYQDEPINTVVTSIQITNAVSNSAPPPATIQYQTSNNELDVISYFQ